MTTLLFFLTHRMVVFRVCDRRAFTTLFETTFLFVRDRKVLVFRRQDRPQAAREEVEKRDIVVPVQAGRMEICNFSVVPVQGGEDGDLQFQRCAGAGRGGWISF